MGSISQRLRKYLRNMGCMHLWPFLLLVVLWIGVPGGERMAQTTQDDAKTATLFWDITDKAGLQFRHLNGATPEKYMPETMGAGAMFFDFNNDSWPDIFLVNGGSLVDEPLSRRARSALHRNNGDGTFTDVTTLAGINHNGYGMGVCAADYNNDGWVDVYLTTFGQNVLYRNNGDGTFTDVTQTAGVALTSWSTGCAFADIDNDGYVDLFVVNYVDFGVDN